MICKFQKALSGGTSALVYDEERTFLWHGPITKELDALFDQHGLKFFAECEIGKKGIDVGKIVEQQEW